MVGEGSTRCHAGGKRLLCLSKPFTRPATSPAFADAIASPASPCAPPEQLRLGRPPIRPADRSSSVGSAAVVTAPLPPQLGSAKLLPPSRDPIVYPDGNLPHLDADASPASRVPAAGVDAKRTTEAERAVAADLWGLLAACPLGERRVLVGKDPAFGTWAAVEMLCAEAVRASASDAGEALDLDKARSLRARNRGYALK